MNLRLLFLVVFDIRWLQLCLELFAGFNFVVPESGREGFFQKKRCH